MCLVQFRDDLSPDEQTIIERIREVVRHGYGRIEVIVTDSVVVNISHTKSETRTSRRKGAPNVSV